MIEMVSGALKWLGELFYKAYAASHAHSREHDVALFKKGDETVNEAFLDNLLNGNLYNHWCWLSDIRTVRHFAQDFRREENQYLDRGVRRAALDAVGTLQKVDSFVGQHCFTLLGLPAPDPDDGIALHLYPELRDSEDQERRERYEQCARDLDDLTTAAWDAYRKYRATVRNRLKV
jgi:hypothetical protein